VIKAAIIAEKIHNPPKEAFYYLIDAIDIRGLSVKFADKSKFE
jgi:hypothetical protein